MKNKQTTTQITFEEVQDFFEKLQRIIYVTCTKDEANQFMSDIIDIFFKTYLLKQKDLTQIINNSQRQQTMKYTIDLNYDAIRQSLSNEQKHKFDVMTNFFIEHHYDEDKSIEELMLDYVARTWPANYMFLIRKCAQEQNDIKLDSKLRVELECLELIDKLTKLHTALFIKPNKSLSKLPKEAIDRLCKQEDIMTQYLLVLQDRLDKDFKGE